MRRIILISAILFISSVFFGCGPKIVKTELDQLFDKNFEGIEIPEVRWIKEGESRGFPYATFDEVWNANILVLMQQGIMVRSSKDTGRIITIAKPPLAIFVERGEVVNVHLNWMEHLYRRVDKPEVVTVQFKLNAINKMTKNFFDKLATQVYAGDKWKWLKNRDNSPGNQKPPGA